MNRHLSLTIDTDASMYTAVVLGSTNFSCTPAGANAAGVKILQHDAEAGDEVDVIEDGITWALAGEDGIQPGDELETDANAKLVVAAGAGTHNICARALESADNNERFKVELVDKQITIS